LFGFVFCVLCFVFCVLCLGSGVWSLGSGVWGDQAQEEHVLQQVVPLHAVRPVVVSEAGSYLRLIDSCITQLKAQGPSRTCNGSKEEEGAYR